MQEGDYQKSGLMSDIYPDFVMMAQSFGVPAKRVTKPEELRPAIKYVSSSSHSGVLPASLGDCQHVSVWVVGCTKVGRQ